MPTVVKFKGKDYRVGEKVRVTVRGGMYFIGTMAKDVHGFMCVTDEKAPPDRIFLLSAQSVERIPEK